MTAVPPLSINGYALQSIQLWIGNAGPWVANVQLTQQPEGGLPAGPRAVRLRVGDTDLTGTVTEQHAFGLRTGARVVGGGGGWQTTLPRKAYHNDAGIKAQLVAADAARDEVIGTFVPSNDRLGFDYVRKQQSASTTLEQVIGGAVWYVDYAGVTHVGARASGIVPKDAYTLIGYDPARSIALLAIDRLADIAPGRVLSDQSLPAPLTIRDIELTSTNGSPLRATCWVQPAEDYPAAGSRLGRLVQAVVSRCTDQQLFGLYRYRVIATRGDKRLDLQAVKAALGLPDLQAVAQFPGLPGAAADLTPGVEVLVSFVDGDPRAPVVTHYAGPGSTGFVPVGLVLGGNEGQPAARQGDSVEVLIPPAVFTGTINGLAATGVVSWVVPKADGVITGGSGKVRIAT